MKKIDILEEMIPDEHKSIIDGFKATKEINREICGKVLGENCEKSLADFEDIIMFLHGKYALSITPKMHIMIDHVGDYIRMTGKPLGYISDQTIEHSHQILNTRMERSKYYVKAIDSDINGENLYKGILHVNSYNL